jgi:hypothetical protein
MLYSLPPSPIFLVRVTQGCAPGDARGRDATGKSRLCGGGRPSQCVPYTNVDAGRYLLTDWPYDDTTNRGVACTDQRDVAQHLER